MKEGDKFIHTDIFGKKWELTYTGTRREVKGCEFEFFIDDEGSYCFFTDTEVERMTKKSERIYYFETDYNNIITKKYIDTDDKNYIRHNDVCVEFKEPDDGTPYYKPERLVKHRNFEHVRDVLINMYEREIKKLQDELATYKNASNHEQYIELIYKNK